MVQCVRVASLVLLLLVVVGCAAREKPVRFATFNASLNRAEYGQLAKDLAAGDPQARNVAEVIQRVRPDVLLINEFDYDPDGVGAELFRSNYLAIGQNGARPIDYPYVFTGPVNTGVHSGFDLNNDGQVVDQPGTRGYGEDAFGYGEFPGQYGMVIYSRYPIDQDRVVDLRKFLWSQMPGARLPTNADGTPWYSPEELAFLRLSSKAHWDVPVRIGDQVVHVLASHPTPPIFDGPEDRNGRRNHDEIRLWADYISGGERARYLYGTDLPSPAAGGDWRLTNDAPATLSGTGQLKPPYKFVIMGDLNADPLDGDDRGEAIAQLLNHPMVDSTLVPTSRGAVEAASAQGKANAAHRGNPSHDTADFPDHRPGNLRVDYVLPGWTMTPVDGGVFWPAAGDPLHRLVEMEPEKATSDHRLVWVDVVVGKK